MVTFLYLSAKMVSRFKVTALKDAAENLTTRKSTINCVRVFGLKKMALRKTLRRFVLSSWIKYSSASLSAVYTGGFFSSVMTNYRQSYKEDLTVA